MNTLLAVLGCILIVIWIALSGVTLVNAIQCLMYDIKREKRELAQAERDREYHTKRMEVLNK